jgi:hypothetical protein
MDETSHPDHPNQKIYRLHWTGTRTPYSDPRTHRMDFHLDEAMRIAGYEEVTVTDEHGNVLWVGEQAMRGQAARVPLDTV